MELPFLENLTRVDHLVSLSFSKTLNTFAEI